MQVVFNNTILYVVAYPTVDGIEVIDKRRGRGALLCGGTAERFKRELADALTHGDQADDLDPFIDNFDALMTQPAIYQ
ncbi:MAG TPA: DUF3567 family protein [Rhodocyclaceae bacterium]|nr:DUF3567 family protein [Rhodocyclaceae bacterium]